VSKKPKTLSGLFLAAAKKLEKPHVSVICFAIEACKTYPVDMRATAKEIVKERLFPHLFYTQWVKANHREAFMKSLMEETIDQDKREGRIAWCHALAEEFKEKPP
jgi:hypothetical protein